MRVHETRLRNYTVTVEAWKAPETFAAATRP
jgi:hypothetical protein